MNHDVLHHGVAYSEALGETAFIGRTRVVPPRNTGNATAGTRFPYVLQLFTRLVNTVMLNRWLGIQPALPIANSRLKK